STGGFSLARRPHSSGSPLSRAPSSEQRAAAQAAPSRSRPSASGRFCANRSWPRRGGGWLAVPGDDTVAMSKRYASPRAGRMAPVVALSVREVGDPRGRAPLLVVHDGPDYVRRGSLLRLLRRLVEAREVPSHRVALLTPTDR